MALGFGAPGQADEDDGLVPGSCRLHPTQVVNRGCVPAPTENLQDTIEDPPDASDVLGDPGITYPNLVPDVRDVFILRPFVFDPETNTFVQGPPQLWFDTWSQNLGTVSLQTTVEEVESPESSTVSQCVSWCTDWLCERQEPVGGYTWHAEHTHFHFDEFAAYELRRLGADGRPDYSDAGLPMASPTWLSSIATIRKQIGMGRPTSG